MNTSNMVQNADGSHRFYASPVAHLDFQTKLTQESWTEDADTRSLRDIEHPKRPARRIPFAALTDFEIGRRARAADAPIQSNPYGSEAWELGWIAHLDAEIARLSGASS